MNTVVAMFFGALGGVCPSLAKLAAAYATQVGLQMPEVGVYVGLVLFAILGAIVAVGFGAENRRAAIIAGIAAPAIVTNVLAGAAAQTQQQRDVSGLLGVSAAYAQSSDVQKSDGGPATIVIVPRISNGGVPLRERVHVDWSAASGARLSASAQSVEVDEEQTLVIPEGATAVEIQGRTVGLEDILRNGGRVNLRVETRPTFAGDLHWALGGARDYSIRSVEILP